MNVYYLVTCFLCMCLVVKEELTSRRERERDGRIKCEREKRKVPWEEDLRTVNGQISGKVSRHPVIV